MGQDPLIYESMTRWPIIISMNRYNFVFAIVFSIPKQQVLRDRCGMSNEDQYAEDVEQYEVKVIHP